MKRTTLVAMAGLLVLLIVVATMVSNPVTPTQAVASIEVTVNGPGTVRMVVDGLASGQEAAVLLEGPSSAVIVGPRKSNGQGVIHATEVLGSTAESGVWTASVFVNNSVVASTTFTM